MSYILIRFNCIRDLLGINIFLIYSFYQLHRNSLQKFSSELEYGANVLNMVVIYEAEFYNIRCICREIWGPAWFSHGGHTLRSTLWWKIQHLRHTPSLRGLSSPAHSPAFLTQVPLQSSTSSLCIWLSLCT